MKVQKKIVDCKLIKSKVCSIIDCNSLESKMN